jgi:photosystem II stability/assembly factor-like uncharacterized protein
MYRRIPVINLFDPPVLRLGKSDLAAPGATKKQQRWTRWGRLALEVLEDRTLLSNWVPIGPAPINNGWGPQAASGRINALAADPSDANTIYIATPGGGVWKTSDGGTTWTPLTDTQSTLHIGPIAIAPGNDVNHRLLYAGTGGANFGYDDFYGFGVLVSRDSGNTWTLTGNGVFNRSAIGKIIIDPTDATGNTVYAAVSGLPTNGAGHGVTGNYGIWKTIDGGATWSNTTASIVPPSGTNPFTDLVMDPGNHNALYAAVGASFGVPANGVYKTTDGGTTWTPTSFLGGHGTGRISLGIADVGISSSLYASVSDPSSDATLEIKKSTDAGTTWNTVMTESSANYVNYMGRQGWYDQTLIVDPNDPTGNTVYAAGQPSVIKTRDGGTTWTDISVGTDGKGPHADHHGIGFDAAGRLLDGNDGGIWRLDNQAPVRWSDLNGNLQITQFSGIAIHPTNPNIAFGGSQDNGTEEYSGNSWTLIYGGDGGFVRVDPNNPLHVYTENFGVSLARSDDGGKSFHYKTDGIQGNNSLSSPYVLDPLNSNRVVLGTQYVNQSLTNGDSWAAIGIPGVGGFNPNRFSVTTIATLGSTVYAATRDGHVWVTTNNGGTWTKTDPIPGFIPIPEYPGAFQSGYQDLEIDPSDGTGQTAYIVTAEFSEDINGTSTGQNHVFMTSNGGTTWTDISGNLPDLPTWSIAIDHANNVLYVGNDSGVYFSTNGGVSWSPCGTGMPNVEVVSLQYSAPLHLLAAGTHGRGMWELSLGGLATHFALLPSANPMTAGSPFQITVTALDDQNNPITGYSGSVYFSSSDGGALLPSDYTFTAADAGVHTFDVTLVTAGSQSITATDTVSGISGTASVLVTAGTADHLLLTAPDPVFSGVPFDITVTVQDAFNNTVTTYQGTVQFSSSDSDPGVLLPADSTFTGGDAGMHTFSGGVILITLGSQTLSGDDASLGISGAATVTVTAPAAPPGGRNRVPGSPGGRLPPWSPLLQPAIPLLPPLVVLTPSPPETPERALPYSPLEATIVTSVFAMIPARQPTLAPLNHHASELIPADASEALFGADGVGVAWTAFP